MFRHDVIGGDGHNKVMLFYTVQFANKLNKSPVIFWSQFVLYFSILTFSFQTQFS